MGMKAKAFLELAQQLSRNTTCEASLRSCISRSYYALFNFMAEFINNNVEKLPQSAEDHKKVYHYLYNCGIEDVETIASALNDLRDERNDSDYKLHLDKFDNKHSSTMYMKAKLAFNSFESITKSRKKCTNVVKGIQRYKNKINS